MNRIFHQQFDRRDWSFSRGHLDLKLGKPWYFSWWHIDISAGKPLIFQSRTLWYCCWVPTYTLIFQLENIWYFKWDTLILQLGTPWYSRFDISEGGQFCTGISAAHFDYFSRRLVRLRWYLNIVIRRGDTIKLWLYLVKRFGTLGYFCREHVDISHLYITWGHLDISVGTSGNQYWGSGPFGHSFSSVVHHTMFCCKKSCQQFSFLLFWDLFYSQKGTDTLPILCFALPVLHLIKGTG